MGSNPILSISVRGVIGSTAGFQPASKGSSPFGRFCLVGSLMAKRLTVNQELMVRVRPFQPCSLLVAIGKIAVSKTEVAGSNPARTALC